jgi:hypothetical protein
VRSREARNVFTRLAELSVHGANVQKGQIVLVQAEIGLEEPSHGECAPLSRTAFTHRFQLHASKGESDGTRSRDLWREGPAPLLDVT